MMQTPYGDADQQVPLAAGVIRYYGSASNMKNKVIVWLDAEANNALPGKWRSTDGWYTGSTYYQMIILLFADAFTAAQVEKASYHILTHHPTIYEALTAISALQTAASLSFADAQRIRFIRANATEWIEERHWTGDCSDETILEEGNVVVKCFCPDMPQWGLCYVALREEEYDRRTQNGKKLFVANVTKDRQLELFDYFYS